MAPVSGVSPHQMTWKRAQGGKGRFFISFDGKLFLQAGCAGSATAVGRSSGKSKSGRTSDAQACVWPHHYCSFRTCSMHIMRAPAKNMAAPWMLKRARAHNILALLAVSSYACRGSVALALACCSCCAFLGVPSCANAKKRKCARIGGTLT